MLLPLFGCDNKPWNSPQPLTDYDKNIRFGSFAQAPKTLDPAQAYSSDEILLISQIYESPLQYHYLKRPYTLVPSTAQQLPVVRYWDAQGQQLPADAPAQRIASTTYDITIQPHIYYQPHPAFARDTHGRLRFLDMTPQQLARITQLSDFPFSATRELTAEDYVYQIKRLAHPAINSPILGLMQEHILGLTAYAQTLQQRYQEYNQHPHPHAFFDLRQYSLPGATVIDRYTYRITLQGQYPQFIFWLATWFFVPIPWEADQLYAQPQLQANNINFSWYPVGTGPYFLQENNPNKQLVLQRNPNFHVEYYPSEGEPGDQQAGYLSDAGKRLPFIDKIVFSLEKEVIPRWNKFLQGYYDQSNISADNFGEAITIGADGILRVAPELARHGIQLRSSIPPSIFYYGFNMLDPLVGGYSARARALRQAIAIAVDIEDYISIFLNGRGIVAQGPLPPGVFGYVPGAAGIDPYMYEVVKGQVRRKALAVAQQLLAQAGYPQGRDARTGKPLVIRLDAAVSSPADKDQFDWLRKQFNRLGITLVVDGTDYNRFQDKVRRGDVQLFTYGWLADYPDAENFLMLFYGPNGTVQHGGINMINYANPAYDQLFIQMKNMANTPQRQALIDAMVTMLRQDSPWIWGFFPKDLVLSHAWLKPMKPHPIANNTLKYQRLDPHLRYQSIMAWNQPIVWPLGILVLLLIAVVAPVAVAYWRKVHRPLSARTYTR